MFVPLSNIVRNRRHVEKSPFPLPTPTPPSHSHVQSPVPSAQCPVPSAQCLVPVPIPGSLSIVIYTCIPSSNSPCIVFASPPPHDLFRFTLSNTIERTKTKGGGERQRPFPKRGVFDRLVTQGGKREDKKEGLWPTGLAWISSQCGSIGCTKQQQHHSYTILHGQ